MKKCTVCMVILALLLSLGAVFASAELPENVSFTPGQYLGGDPDAYSPVGEITVAWRSNFTSEVDLTDGDLSDWYATDLTRTNITPDNMVYWVGDGAVTDFKITSFCAADADYLYLAFDVVDPDFAYGTQGGHYNGDAIQVTIDFGHKQEDVLESDPDVLGNPKNVFYSFSCNSDGAPICIMRQESDRDGLLTEANGDGIKGAARKTELGWSAEIALSWQTLYDNWVWKAWCDDGGRAFVGSNENLSLKMGGCLYYLDRAETDGTVLWAAGTVKDYKTDDGAPVVSWTVYDNGITWTLPYREDLTFNCNGIVVIPPEDTTVLDTLPPETEPPYDPPTEEITELASEAPTLPPVWADTVAPTYTGDELDELQAVLEKYGCTSVVGLGSLAILMTLAAAAYVTSKKH